MDYDQSHGIDGLEALVSVFPALADALAAHPETLPDEGELAPGVGVDLGVQ